MVIDWHTHFYPVKYIKWLKNRKIWPAIEEDSFGRKTLIIDNGHKVAITDSFYKIEKRIKKMDASEISLSVLSLSNPWVDFGDTEKAVILAKLVNEEIARITEWHPNRFIGLATLPFSDVEEALDELDRAVKDLGMKGIIMPTNILGKPLDSPEFWPIYEKVDKLNIPIFIHPATPVEIEVMQDYNLSTMIGFPFETSLATVRLILSGVIEKNPTLKIVAAHLGGVLPYLVGRIDRGYTIFPDCQTNISKPPSVYLRQIYLDTISFHKPALMCAYEFVGADKLVFGSDYPFLWTIPSSAIREIRELNLSENEERKIFSQNAANLLGIA